MKKRYTNISLVWILTVILILSLSVGSLGKVAKEATPSPDVVDIIIHDKGNIAVSILNYGCIYNYSTYGYPSGEWPKNSGHDYIGGMEYWMGAVVDGDTIVADANNDFQPIASLVSGINNYGIRVSTDTTTYDYDPTDTIGQGIGNPAYGWRVWDSDGSSWNYNQVYNFRDSLFYSGGPTGQQQSFYRFDDGGGTKSLGLELSQTIYQWNYSYNKDLLFVILEITNASYVDYQNFVFAIYSDFDIGGPDGTGENGRLGDLVAFDSAKNLAWTYDEDGYDPGWGPTVQTGIMGTKYLETPDGIGMTAFRTGQWEQVYEASDPEKFVLINSEQYDESLPPADQYYLQCTKGINLTAGKTVKVVYAIIAGKDSTEFYNNADMAQTLYDNHFIGPKPPTAPILQARVGDTKAYLSWDDAAESDVDALSGLQDFRGYKLYRSTNLGYTWGHEAGNDSFMEDDYIPIAKFSVSSAGEVIQHTYIDTGLTNGMEYWYCLVAYDAGDVTVNIDTLQNGFGKPNSDYNTVKVIPRSDPVGSYTAQSTVEHSAPDSASISDGAVYTIVFDDSQLVGEEYRVVFSDDDFYTYWHLINDSTGDTVLVNQTLQEGDPDLYEVGEGIRVVVRNGERYPFSMAQTGFGEAGDTTLSMGDFLGTITDEISSLGIGSDKHFRSTYELRFTENGSQGYRMLQWYEGYLYLDFTTPVSLPFEVWNVTENKQVRAEIWEDYYHQNEIWEPQYGDVIIIVNTDYDNGNERSMENFQYYVSWLFCLNSGADQYNVGDVYTLAGAPLNGPNDVFTFKVDGVNADSAKTGISRVRVVPDPYIVHAEWEYSRYGRKIQFIHLPEICTIRIYTLGGDLVNKLEHSDGTGTADWNMLSEYGLGIAPGIYLYHVQSEYGEHIGRFAVIK